jgi:hypothetical protein
MFCFVLASSARTREICFCPHLRIYPQHLGRLSKKNLDQTNSDKSMAKGRDKTMFEKSVAKGQDQICL